MPGVVMKKNINPQDDAKSITHFLSQVFRKVVRLVIGTVSLPALYDILKAIYVEEAQKAAAQASQGAQATTLPTTTTATPAPEVNP